MRCLLIADPCGDLPEAREEAATLKQWLSNQGIECDLLLGDEANGTEVIIRLSADTYNFVHYSGHVGIVPTTKTHGLILSDQQLSSAEIERAISNNGPVVVLNGCDSASVEGLADAFLKSGAQLVVGTLFDVPDAGARRWAEVFYEALISKQQAGEALRMARQAIRDEPAYSTAWTAFVMYGNPCLQLIWEQGLQNTKGTLLDRALQTIELERKNFDNACLNVLESSLKNAGKAGCIGSADFFTAMLEGPDSRLRDYLQAHGIDPADMRKEFEESNQFRELLAQMILVDKESGIRLSDSVSAILRKAFDRARQAKRSQATFDDLLFAFTQQSSGISTLLQFMGIDLKDMAHSLQEDTSTDKRYERAQKDESEDAASKILNRTGNRIDHGFRTRGTKTVHNESTTLGGQSSGKDIVEPEPFTVERFANVSFPSSVVKSCWYTLQIQICVTQRAQQDVVLGMIMPGKEQPAIIEACVHAPGFEAMGALQKELEVPPDGDSKVIDFRLCAQRPGTYKIQVDFFQNHYYIGSTHLEVKVLKEGEQSGSEAENKAKTSGQPAIGQIGAAPDITILIAEQPLSTGEHQLKFMLHSPSNDLYYRDVGGSTLNKAPDKWVNHVLEQLPEIARKNNGGMVERRLKGIGNTLWEELIPETFQNIYWKIRDNIQTVLIVTDDPWIPWELLHPHRQTQQGSEEDDFLCQRFSVARWLRGKPTSPKIFISESRFIGVGIDDSRHFIPLPNVNEEIATIKSIMEGAGACTVSLEPSCSEFFHTLELGKFHHLHIACHGSASPQSGDFSIIVLKDGVIAPLDITGTTMNFERNHPIVFLNACETGRLGISLTQIGGWAEQFIQAGCGAFVGTMWKVSDISAHKFAEIFYDEICRGTTLGEACRHARSGIRESGDPTWLAYCLYADPQTILTLPGEVSAPNSIEPEQAIEAQKYTQAVLQALTRSERRSAQVQVNFIDSLLFFEALLEIPNGAADQAFQRLGISTQELLQGFRKVNNSSPPSQEPPTKKIGKSKSVEEILKIAHRLASQSSHNQVQDSDILEAFVLHEKNGVIRLLSELGIESWLLLNGAFHKNGALNRKRFSRTAKIILEDMLQMSRRTRLVGSPQVLAALVNKRGSLARKTLKVQGGNLDTLVQKNLKQATVYEDRLEPEAVTLDTCSTRARCILNLAELLAQIDGTPVEEDHLLKAYIHCTESAR